MHRHHLQREKITRRFNSATRQGGWWRDIKGDSIKMQGQGKTWETTNVFLSQKIARKKSKQKSAKRGGTGRFRDKGRRGEGKKKGQGKRRDCAEISRGGEMRSEPGGSHEPIKRSSPLGAIASACKKGEKEKKANVLSPGFRGRQNKRVNRKPMLGRK